MRIAHLALGVVFSAGCGSAGVFACTDDGDCSGGVCQASGYCSFADGGCASGQRYGEHAPATLASRCVPVDGDELGEGSGTASSIGSTGTTTATGTDPTTGDATTAALTTAPGSSSSEGGSSDSGGLTACALEEFEDPRLDTWLLYADEPVGAFFEDDLLILELASEVAYAGLELPSVGVPDGVFDLVLGAPPEQLVGTQLYLAIGLEGEAYLLLLEEGLLIVRHDQGAGYEEPYSAEWQPDELYLRIEIAGGQLAFSRSRDGVDYATLGAVEPEVPLDGAVIFAATGTWQPTPNPGLVVVDRISFCESGSG